MMVNNYMVTFVKRPVGEPQEDIFSYEECSYPEIADGEMLIKTLYLSVDPVQRMMMKESALFTPMPLGEVVNGYAGVGVVIESKHPGFKVGDIVRRSELGGWPWKLYFKTANVDNKFQLASGDDPKYEISYYAMPGLSVMAGLSTLGSVILENRGKGKTFVVSGAMGSCGHLAGQIAAVNGCSTVVGIAGSDEKCKILTDQLKFTNAINYKTDNINAKLKEFCPSGVDVYYDNVGGEISESVISHMNENGVVIVCGQISGYNRTDKAYPHTLPEPVAAHVKKMNILREPFMASTFADKFPQFREYLYKLKHEHGIQILDTTIDGMQNLPKAFCGMMAGKNIGKQVVKISDL